MNGFEGGSGLTGLRERLREILRLRLVALAVVASLAYLGSYLILCNAAVYHRRAGFSSSGVRPWVQLGSLRFSIRGFESFMGSVYHPILLVLIGLPALLFALFLLFSGALIVWGFLAGLLQDRLDRREEKERREYQLSKTRVEAEARRPMVISAAGELAYLGECRHCRSRLTIVSGTCPNCGRGVTA